MGLKFRQRQVADPRAQENFDQLQTMFPLGVSDLATGILLELAVSGTRRKVAFGTGSATFTAAATSAGSVVAHGLGRTPQGVWLQELNGFARFLPSALDATNFTATGYVTNNVATSGTLGFYWVAIG